MTAQPHEALEGLIAKLLDGDLAEAEAVELTDRLRSDPQARAAYHGQIQLHAMLHWIEGQAFEHPAAEENSNAASSAIPLVITDPPVSGAAGIPTMPPRSPVLGFLDGVVSYVGHSRTLMFWLLFGVFGLYFAGHVGALLLSRFWAQNAAQLAEDRDHGSRFSVGPNDPPIRGKVVARLTNVIDCQWAIAAANRANRGQQANAISFAVGADFRAGQKLYLTAGLAELTFESGAKVILHAPAQFDVTDALGGDLQRGKLTAKVPHAAAGFTINTPGGKVVDLGTEFGVKVNDNGIMDVIVYVGEVEVNSNSGGGTGAGGTDPPKVLHVKAGQAFTIGPDHIPKPTPPDNERFVRDLAPLGDKTKVEAAYVEFMKSLKPVVWFRMEGKETDRTLHDEAGPAEAKLNWDGPGNPFKKGLFGSGLWLRGETLKDYAIALDYPKAEHGRLTVAAWVYADSYLTSYARPILCNWSDTDGVGQFYFGLLKRPGRKEDTLLGYISDRSGHVVFTAESSDHPFPLYTWQHVAFTTDGATLRLYRQGSEVASLKHAGLLYPVPLKGLGVGTMLNNAGDSHCVTNPHYFWDGKLDEIAIFNDTLTPEDIKKLAGAAPR